MKMPILKKTLKIRTTYCNKIKIIKINFFLVKLKLKLNGTNLTILIWLKKIVKIILLTQRKTYPMT